MDQRVRHQLHAIVLLLDTFKAEQEPLELVFPGKGPFNPHPQRMEGGVAEALASTLRALTVPRSLWNIGDQARIEDALPIVRGIKATIQGEIRTLQVQTDLFGYACQRFQTLREQHHIRCIDWSDWTWC